MCLIDSAEQIHKASAALMVAKDRMAAFEETVVSAQTQDGPITYSVDSLTEAEARSIYASQIKRAEDDLKALLYTKAAPADPADSQRVINQRTS